MKLITIIISGILLFTKVTWSQDLPDYTLSPESITNKMLEFISCDVGEERDWDVYRNLFLPTSLKFSISTSRDGKKRVRSMNLEEFVRYIAPLYKRDGFEEYSIGLIVNEFNGIANVFQTFYCRNLIGTYEKRGVNSFQLIHDKGRWWIANTMFTNESEETPLSEDLLFKAYRGKSISEYKNIRQAESNQAANNELDLKTLNFEIQISAPPSEVYFKMLEKEKFEAWTSIFDPSSRLVGDWDQGSTMYFLAKNESGGEDGLISVVKENIKDTFLSMEHIGVITNGENYFVGELAEAFKGGVESYTFVPIDEGTLLKVRTDIFLGQESFFKDKYPKALLKVKEICERKE